MRHFLLFVILFTHNFLAGQPKTGSQYYLNINTKKHGFLKDVFLDTDNKLWIKTSKEVIYKDGIHETTYKNNQKTLKTNPISDFYSIGNKIFLVQKNDTVLIEIDKSTKKISKSFYNLPAGTNHSKYYKDENEFLNQFVEKDSKIQITNLHTYSTRSFAISENVSTIYYSKLHSGLWILTQSGQIMFLPNNGELKYIGTVDSKTKNNKSFLAEDSEGILWLKPFRINSLYKIDINQKDKIKKVNHFGVGEIKNIWTDNEHNILVLVYYSKFPRYRIFLKTKIHDFVRWKYLESITDNPKKILATNFLNEMLIYSSRGLRKISFPPIYLSHYNYLPNLTSRELGVVVSGITRYNDSLLIYSTNYEFLQFFNINTKVSTPIKTPIKSAFVCFIEYDSLTNKILLNYSKDIFQVSHFNLAVFDFTEKKITPLFGTATNTFAKKNDDEFVFVNDTNIYVCKNLDHQNLDHQKLDLNFQIKNKPGCINYDKKSSLLYYYVINEGLRKINLSTGTTCKELMLEQISDPNLLINYIKISPGDKYYLLTNQGVMVINKNNDQLLEILDFNKGLSNNVITSMEVDSFGNQWYSTLNGLSVYSKETQNFFNIKNEDGLINSDFTTNSSLLMNNRFVYFGSANGLLEIDLEKYYSPKKYNIDYDIQIAKNSYITTESFVTNKIENNTTVFLEKGETIHEIQLTNSKLNNELVNYYYKSDTTNYSIIGDKTFRELNSLAIGQYPITIRGFDRHGIPSSNQVSFILDIKKPFYLILQQYLFICLFIIVFFIIYIIYDRNQKNKLMRNHQLLEFELSSLQSQLNPHFISNSMLAINNFIKENNSTIAENYIMDFSRLMRLVLESSKLKTISLKDEIDLLKYYSKLEQLRFNNSFDIQIDIDEAIDLELLQIPSMMIQPYIENAINHGLINKKQGRGLLQISIQEHQDESIRFVIQDNGIGYNNKKIQNNKKSRSSQLISDRVSLLKSLSDIDISINILDLSEQDPKLTGTLVEIIFPEIY